MTILRYIKYIILPKYVSLGHFPLYNEVIFNEILLISNVIMLYCPLEDCDIPRYGLKKYGKCMPCRTYIINSVKIVKDTGDMHDMLACLFQLYSDSVRRYLNLILFVIISLRKLRDTGN